MMWEVDKKEVRKKGRGWKKQKDEDEENEKAEDDWVAAQRLMRAKAMHRWRLTPAQARETCTKSPAHFAFLTANSPNA